MKQIVLIFINLYRKLISPFLGQHCRFYPSCSEYSHDVFKTQGMAKASFLSIRRILSCNPFSKGGYDPAPYDERARD